MTAFGIYLVIVQILGICSTGYYVSQGKGAYNSHGVLVFSLLWACFNLIGVLLWGTGVGV